MLQVSFEYCYGNAPVSLKLLDLEKYGNQRIPLVWQPCDPITRRFSLSYGSAARNVRINAGYRRDVVINLEDEIKLWRQCNSPFSAVKRPSSDWR
jgi:hypothetical protein